jgi:hypothetical protein
MDFRNFGILGDIKSQNLPKIIKWLRSYLRGYNESEKPQDVSAYQMKELIADIKGVITG